MLSWASNGGRIGFPDIGDISIELEFIAVRIEDVEAMGDGVIGGADNSDTCSFEFLLCLAELFIGIPNLQSDMVETWFRDMFGPGNTADFDEEQLMVGAAGSEEGTAAHLAFDLGEAESIAVESAGAFEVRNIEDNMTKFMDFHRGGGYDS